MAGWGLPGSATVPANWRCGSACPALLPDHGQAPLSLQAARQAEQLAKLGLDNDPGKAAEGRRQRANLEKMVADVAAAAEASAATAAEAAGDFCARLPGLACLPGFTPPAPEYVAGLEAKAAEATALARGVVDPSQAPAKPVPAAAPTGASSSAASGSTPSPSPASEPVVPAPQPGAGRAARAPGAGRRKEEGAASSGCAAVSAPAPATPPLDMSSLEARLAALEEANRQKDAQIAAMLSSAAAADVAVTAAPLAALGIPPLSPSLLSSPLGLMPPAGGSAGLGSLGPSPRMNGHAAATAAAADGGDGTETGAAAGTGRRNRRRA